MLHARNNAVPWQAIPGIGALISNTSRPEPDVMVLPRDDAPDLTTRDTQDALVLFEVMSPSTSKRDLHWKRDVYATLPALTHCVVVAPDTVDVVVFARDAGFAEWRARWRGRGDCARLPRRLAAAFRNLPRYRIAVSRTRAPGLPPVPSPGAHA